MSATKAVMHRFREIFIKKTLLISVTTSILNESLFQDFPVRLCERLLDRDGSRKVVFAMSKLVRPPFNNIHGHFPATDYGCLFQNALL